MMIQQSRRLVLGTVKKHATIVLATRSFSIDEIGKRYGKPFDYEKKQYGLMGQIFDSTLNKLGENSLIITVEGNFGAGKTEFAKALAKSIDFVYAREPDLEHHLFTLPNGQSMREIVNEKVTDNKLYHIDSLAEWHSLPSFKSTIALQHSFYIIRWMQMRNALLHLFSTGQGVVLERSVFSDRVIAESLYENKFMSEEAWKFYIKDLVPMTVPELWKPHVSIYLDKAPEDCLNTIRAKEQTFESKSQVYSIELLTSMNRIYKKYIANMKSDMHCLTYNSNEATVDRVMEDMEMLNFEDETKFNDWRIRKETKINSYRRSLSNLANCKHLLQSPTSYVHVPEYLLYGEELRAFREALKNDPRYSQQDKNTGLFSKLTKANKEKIWF